MTGSRNEKSPIHIAWWYKRLFLLAIVLALGTDMLSAQENEYSQVNSLLEQAGKMLEEENYSGASTFSKKALATAKLRRWSEEEGKSYLILAKVSFRQAHYAEALSFGVQAAAKFELTDNTLLKISSFRLMTEIYDRIQTYQRAITYGEKLEKIYLVDSANTISLADLRFNMSRWFVQLKRYERAESYAYTSLNDYQRLLDTPELAKVHELIVEILQSQQKYEEAIPHALWLTNIYRLEKDYEHRITGFNTLGFLYQKTGKDKEALDAFEKAANLSQNLSKNASVTLLVNLGLANSNLGNDKEAIRYYQRALDQQKRENNAPGEAEVYNYLASHYFLSGRQEKALETAADASQIALEQQDNQLLSDNYLLLKLIYQKEEHWEKAEEYGEKLKQLKLQMQQNEARKQEEQQRMEQMAELHEEEIRIVWNDKEKLALEKERQGNQLKMQQQQLNLLKKEKELQALALEKQKLESRNAKQALSIVQQRLISEKQENALSDLTRSKELQALKIREQALEKQQQEQTISLLEADKKLKQQKLEKEASLRKYSIGILALCILIILAIAFFFVQKSKDNRTLLKQKEEISTKNELLRQNEVQLKDQLDYLETARQILSDQQEQLIAVHNRVQQSIEYAKHIQTSILPDEDYLKSIFPDSCVIFMPKDVVSGDFYWITDHGDYQMIIVADCTGHGVPGALITLIGHSLLTEAIQVNLMTEPDSILHFLHQRLLDRFQSQESTRQHGMDMGICIVRRDEDAYSLSFAGAKNNLSYTSGGAMHKVKGDRCSVGGSRTNVSFTRHQVRLQSQDTFYLSSDGFIDQPNPERRRLGSKKLARYIEEWQQLPMSAQEQKLLNAFLSHKQDTELRDDVTLLGIRL